MNMITRMGLLGAFVWMLAAVVQSQPLPGVVPSEWEFTTKDEAITIARYAGSSLAVTIPSTLNGLPVTSIGDKAFWSCTNLITVTVPATVTRVGDYAFGMCTKLKGVYFMSNAPHFGSSVFYKNYTLTVFHLPGTTGWDQECCDRPTAHWNQSDPIDALGGVPSK